MRTTLDLDPSVLQAAKQLAQHQSISIGKAVSALALRGLHAPANAQPFAGGVIPTFHSRPNPSVVTLEDVQRCLDDEL